MQESTLNPLTIGTVVHERYQVESIVGRGGLGTVYCVRDIIFGKQNIFALKEMADQSRSARRQFEHEAQWLQALDHNHIPKVREYFEWHTRLYLVMDFVDGENLEQKLYRQGGKPLPEEQVIAWILPVCDALQYLHTRTPSILHRDVKPANIIVTPAGHPVLVDLGIAKEHLPGANRTATFVRKAGTEGYAPPEQYTVAGKSGPWSDVYALGATLYHLLTCQVPVSAIERVTQDPDLVPPSFYNRAISAQTDAAICRAMAMRPSERFQSVAEFAAALSGSPETFAAPRQPGHSPRSNVPRGSAPSVPSFAPGWESSRPPRGPQLPPSAPPQGAPQPFARPTSPGGAPSFAPPRTPPPASQPSAPPSRHPSFAGSPPPMSPPPMSPPPMSSRPSVNDLSGLGASSGMINRGQLGGSLPPLPPAPPSVANTLKQGADLAPQSSPSATAAQYERIRESVTGHARKPTTRPREAKARGPLLTGIALVLILLAAGIATLMILPRLAPPDRSTPQATITGYFGALQQDDFSRAWQFISASRTDSGSQGAFAQNMHADDTRYGRVVSIHIVSTETDNANHATVQVQVTRAIDVNTPIVYSIALSQYDGTTWLVDSVTNQ